MFILRFETDNDAFNGIGRNYEAAQILKSVADKVKEGNKNGSIRDYNGNTIGQYEWVKE